MHSFLSMFHILVQPSATLKPVLSLNASWLLLFRPEVIMLNGAADLCSTTSFILHLLSTASMTSGELLLEISIVYRK